MPVIDSLPRWFVHGVRWLLYSPLRIPLSLDARLAIVPVIVRLDAPLRAYLARCYRQGVSGS